MFHTSLSDSVFILQIVLYVYMLSTCHSHVSTRFVRSFILCTSAPWCAPNWRTKLSSSCLGRGHLLDTSVRRKYESQSPTIGASLAVVVLRKIYLDH